MNNWKNFTKAKQLGIAQKLFGKYYNNFIYIMNKL